MFFCIRVNLSSLCENGWITCGFAWEFLQSGKRYRPGQKLKRLASLVVCTRKNFLVGKCGFLVSDVISGGLLGHRSPLHLALGPNCWMVVFHWSFCWKLGYNLSFLILWITCWGFGFKSYYLKQGSPNYGPRARCGPRSHFIWPAKPFCQWWKNNIQSVWEICYLVEYKISRNNDIA